MKKTLLAVTTCLSFFSASAFATEFYFQGQLGYGKLNDANSESLFNDPALGDLTINLQYDTDFVFGLEAGIAGFESADVLRLGLAWQTIDAELDTAYVGVTNSVNPLFPDGSYRLNDDQTQALGYNFNNSINLYSANLYYDFPVNSNFKPYIGFGLGLADIEHGDDEETALIMTLGGNYNFNDHFSIGVKYQYVSIKSITDDLNIEYSHGKVHMLVSTAQFKF